jgi:hypothetical protein
MTEHDTENQSRDDESEYEYPPTTCGDCGGKVVVTRNEDAEYADDHVKFECGCSVGSIAASKPDSWTGGAFL